MPRPLADLGRRERQIMDIVVRRPRASVADVLADLPDPPTYSAVRGMLRLLEDKGYVRHEWDGPRFVYVATADPTQLKEAAVSHLVETFFDNSMESAVVALLDHKERKLSRDELDRLAKLIDKAKRSGGRK
jgi:BlaI family transcriptional regulator, penicillinase repressor